MGVYILLDGIDQVGITRQGSSRSSAAPHHEKPSPSQPQPPDADVAEVMGCFASPRRFGHYGSIDDACALAYEPTTVSGIRCILFFLLRAVDLMCAS